MESAPLRPADFVNFAGRGSLFFRGAGRPSLLEMLKKLDFSTFVMHRNVCTSTSPSCHSIKVPRPSTSRITEIGGTFTVILVS